MTNQQIFEMIIATLQVCQDRRQEYLKAMNYTPKYHQASYSVEVGRKFARLIQNDSQRSVIGFINLENGDLHKAASWKQPAKNFVRGNAIRGDFKCCGPFSIG